MYNSGILAKRLNEGSTTTKGVAKASPLTVARLAATKQIEDMAGAYGMSLDEAVTKVLVDPKSQEALRYYVQSKYEAPFSRPVKLAVQCILMRFADIATIAKALNISDAEALVEVENGEFQAIENNIADGGILPTDVQAALLIGVAQLIDKANAAGLPATTPGLLGAIKVVTGDNYDNSMSSLFNVSAADNADGVINLGDFRPDVGTVDTSGVYSSGGGGWSWDSIFSTINSAIGVVKNAAGAVGSVTGAIQTAGGTATGVINQVGGAVTNAAGGIGGAAINKSSLPWIIGGGFALIIIVIIIIYASKSK